MPTESKRKPQPRMVDCTCKWCKGPFQARAVDVARGWGKFCSKSCKAMRQEKTTGQYRALTEIASKPQWERDHDMHIAALDGMTDSDYGASDGGAHIFDSSGHGQF